MLVYGKYVHQVARFGISARADQGIAGSLMMIVDSVVTIAAIAWLFLKLAAEGELRQRLLDIQYGRADDKYGWLRRIL